MTKKEILRYDMIAKGVALLKQQQEYTQITLVRKAAVLGHVFATASLTNILNKEKGREKPIGLSLLKTVSDGIAGIIRSELGMEYNEKQQAYVSLPHFQEIYIVPEKPIDAAKSRIPVLHPDGRLPIPEKTAFIEGAQKEVIEFGVRLRTFSEYFTSSSEKEYKAYIIKLLEKGVNVTCYLLDPESQQARMYFEDRIKVMPHEKDAIEETRKAVERLKTVIREFEERNYRGKFEVWKYQHIPYNLFLAVDPDTPGGKMLISHYIYGIRRAEAPVMEIEKEYQPELYKKYRESLLLYIKDAIRIDVARE